MFGLNKKRFSDMGEVKRDTNQLINENIERQQEMKKTWTGRRPKTLAVSDAKNRDEPIAVLPSKPSSIFNDDAKKGFIATYWFPLLCLAAVVSVAIWTFWPSRKPGRPSIVPEPVVTVVDKDSSAVSTKPEEYTVKDVQQGDLSFDIVRIESNGSILVAGKIKKGNQVSISINKQIVSTMSVNDRGEFVYAPKTRLKPGNYVVQLFAGNAASDKVFVYVAEKAEQSLSLLMTKDSSRILQAPQSVASGDLVVTKIDYLENRRVVVQGRALPRLRVSLSMDGKLLGMARVSDHRNFGLGAGVGALKAGDKHTLSVKLHDGQSRVVADIDHEFVMPEMTKADETFYVVRKGDALWIISRNFLGKGIRFSIIANANNIENPDLIYPNQKFRIPIGK